MFREFDLADDFDLDAFDRASLNRGRLLGLASLPLGFLVGYIFLRWATEGFAEIDGRIGLFGLAALGLGCIAFPIVEYLADRCSPNPFAESVAHYRRALRDFEKAKADWEDRQLETGITYWRGQRGTAFELAARDFLARRGCTVQTTKGSGDGGVDLVIRLGSSLYWCQCKGHAAPVGVSTIREIAGVCSRGNGSPVVMAVNGYTRAAMETAQELGVLLIDTHHLVEMAHNPAISSLQGH